jgi:hypothetical protein
MLKLVFGFFFISISVVAQDTTRLSMLFIGDIMQHDSQIEGAYDTLAKKYEYGSCFQYVKPLVDSVDLAIGNLEVTLAGLPYKGYPMFSAPDELASTLKDIGLDVLVTANNHCVDRGRRGLERTITMLDSLEISHTGTFVDTVTRMNDYPLMVHKKGFSICLLNYTYGTNGMPVEKPNMVNKIDTITIKKDLEKAKGFDPDAIIVFMHWGSEYQSLPSNVQKDLTDFCLLHGAKLVIGSHPHVLQPIEWRKEKDQLVAYSLGNFVSGQRKRYTDGGLMLNVDLEKITQSDSSSDTHIRDSSYQLEWVYRTSGKNKKYFILPAHQFEERLSEENQAINENLNLPLADKKAFQLFLHDSRVLLNTYNLEVKEEIKK